MNTFRKVSTMTPAAKVVLDTTTAELAKARAQNATLRRENDRLQRAMDMFLASPSKIARDKAAKAMRYYGNGTPARLEKIATAAALRKVVAPVVKPILNPDGSIDKVATAIKTVHASARR